MKKLTERGEAYAILRKSGKSIREAYKMAGFKGKEGGSTPYGLERRIKTFSLDHPELLKLGGNVAKLTLKIAEQALKDKEKQKLSNKEEICLKKAHEIYLEQQKRESPVINRNVNLNVNTGIREDLIDLSAYEDTGSGEEFAGQVISAEFTKQEPQ